VTLIHTYEGSDPGPSPDDPPGLRRLTIDPSQLPPVAFACDDHARSAAAMQAIEDAFGNDPPDYLEVPDYHGHGLVPLQARNAGHRSLRGCSIGVRLRGSAEIICMLDGTWPRPEHRIVFDFEREVLRLADFVVWPGGDVLRVYEDLLQTSLPSGTRRLRLPVEQPPEPPKPAARPAEEPLRILYAGRLQRVKGVLSLVEACTRIDGDDWRLTMIGADTDTAPLGWSVRATIETICAGDTRVTILDPVSREALQARFEEHDLLVVPSEFDVWPNVALEAMRAGLPVLASPVGGLTEIVANGLSGWHTSGTDRRAIQSSIERLLADRDELERVRVSGEVFRHFERLTAEAPVLAGYRELLEGLRPVALRTPPPRRSSLPLVTGIVPYYGEHEWIGAAVDSLLSQTHRNLAVTIVNDGSFEPEDSVLFELAEDRRVHVLTQPNQGEQAARNLAAIDAEGEYLAMLDADNLYEPEFVERAVAMLEADPALAYVTCWLRFVGEQAALESASTQGYPPLGNGVRSDEAINSDGDAIAVMPRRLFSELGYRYDEMSAMSSDWSFYRLLRDDGRFGAVIPERLARYRLRDDSLSHAVATSWHADSWDETRSRRRARRLQVTRSA
jgi:glycogen(starch) synthase